MTANYNKLQTLTGNGLLLFVVDAWRWRNAATAREISVKLNRNITPTGNTIQFWFFQALGRPYEVEGSVKMGQPIKHTTWGVLPVTKIATSRPGTAQATYAYFSPTTPPATFFVVVWRHTVSGQLVNTCISAPMAWASLPLRAASAGGY